MSARYEWLEAGAEVVGDLDGMLDMSIEEGAEDHARGHVYFVMGNPYGTAGVLQGTREQIAQELAGYIAVVKEADPVTHTFVPSGIQGDPSCAECALPRENARHLDNGAIEQIVVLRVRHTPEPYHAMPANWGWSEMTDAEVEVVAAGPVMHNCTGSQPGGAECNCPQAHT